MHRSSVIPERKKASPMSKATLHNWNDIENEQLNPLLSRKFVTGEKSMFARVVLAKGCVVPRHSHHNEQITFITQGALRFDFDDGTSLTVHEGEVLVIPGDLPHSATALSDCIDFDIFAPPRQDWIDKDDSYLRK
jgi:quercetin dioxygenase-like cupin family protein